MSSASNDYHDRLTKIDLDQLIQKVYDKLEDWCCKSHRTIDEYYEKKKKSQLDPIVAERKEKFEKLKKSVESIGNDPTADDANAKLLAMKVRSIERDLKSFEENFLRIRYQPIQLDDQLIEIEREFRLQRLVSAPSTLPYSQESSAAIAANSKHLLIHQSPYLCLIDEKCRILRQINWNAGWIRDMTWAKIFNAFVLITADELFLVDSTLKSIALQQIMKKRWFSCAASDTALFLSTWQWGSTIYQFDSFDNDPTKFWTCPPTEGIHDIQTNDRTLALLVKDARDFQRRMDLKSIETKETLWSLPFSKGPTMRLFSCSPINCNEWLIVDGNSSKIHHVTSDGKLKDDLQYPSVPYRTVRFTSNVLVVAAETHLNFHLMSD